MHKKELPQQGKSYLCCFNFYNIKINPGCRVGASMPKSGGVYEAGRERQQNGVRDSEGAEKGRALVPPHPSAVIPR